MSLRDTEVFEARVGLRVQALLLLHEATREEQVEVSAGKQGSGEQVLLGVEPRTPLGG